MSENTKKEPKSWEIFSAGELLCARLSSKPIYIPQRGKYCYRIRCTFSSGLVKKIQTRYYDSEEETLSMRPFHEKQAVEKRIAVFKCTVKEFQSLWWRCGYFDRQYNKLIKTYLIPELGNKCINEVSTEDLVKILEKIPNDGILKREKYFQVCDAISHFFEIAVKYHCAEQDAGTEASVLMKYKKTGQEEGHSSRAPVSETFSPEQVLLLLKRCQREARSIYLPMLLAVTAGLTVSEIIGIKFDDVDFHNQILYLPYLPDTYLCSRPDTVILYGNARKAVFLSDLVVDEIRLQKNHLEMLRQTEPGFNAAGYMICTNDGQQRKKRFIEKPYARMLSRCRLPAHPWKNFRKIQLNQYGLQKFTDALAPQNPLSQASYKLPFDRNFLTGLLN